MTKPFSYLKNNIINNNEILHPNVSLNLILSDKSSIYINNSYNTLIFDLQAFNEIITKIFPNYLLYKIDPSNYLFPVCFTKHAQAEIDTKELINYLKKYFAEYFLYTAIKYECNIDKLIVDCGQHVFYQIIFSLLYNLINFMEDQSKIPKSLCITFTTHKLTIFYDEFLLTEQIMVNLSNSMIVETIDPFLLNCSKIFQPLKEHGLNYAIYNENKRNIIETELRKTTTANKEKAKVISLKKYKHIK